MSEQVESDVEEDRPNANDMPEITSASATKRHVSFQGEQIELKDFSSSQQSNTGGDDLIPMRERSRSEVAPRVLERFVVTRERKWSISAASLIAALPALLLGLTLAYPSNAILDLTGEATELPSEFFFSSLLLLSVFAALGPLGAIFGGPVGGWIADRWGRKCGLMFSGVPYLIGYLILSYAHYAPTVTVFNTLLLTGRSLAGFGMGWAAAVCPVYTGELCSAKLRGIYGTVFPVFITVGILLSYALGAIRDFRYYQISLVAVGIVTLFEILMFWLPETPRWLLSRGYREQAEDVLLWLRGKKLNINTELEDMKKSISKRKAKVWKLFLKPSVLKPLVYILIIFGVQQGGGINAITPFAGTLLSNAGVSNPRTTTIYAVGVSGLATVIVSAILIDFSGRKFLLIVSGAGQFLGTVMLGIHAFVTRPSLCSNSSAVDDTEMTVCNPQFQYLALTSIIFFCVMFVIGYNSVPFVLLSELLPLPVRGIASGMATAMSWVTAAIFTGFYLEFTKLVRPWFVLWAIAGLNIATVVFVIIFIPETKGKRLEELENLFVKKPDIVKTVL